MSDENKNLNDGQKRGGDFRMASRNWIMWILIVCCVLLVALLKTQMTGRGEEISQNQFMELYQAKRITEATVKFNPQSQYTKEVVGTYSKDVERDGKLVQEKHQFW